MRYCLLILFFVILFPIMGVGEINNFDQGNKPIINMEVGIAPNGISVPKGFILLARRNSEYCSIKFTKFWTGKTMADQYATYESYCQADKTGNFANRNVKYRKDKLSRSRLRGFGRLSFSFGNTDINCGTMKLSWFGKWWVCFFSSNQDQGDYGIQLAPTKWTDISQVNVFDRRLKWYRYDTKRQRITIPVELLQNKEDGSI